MFLAAAAVVSCAAQPGASKSPVPTASTAEPCLAPEQGRYEPDPQGAFTGVLRDLFHLDREDGLVLHLIASNGPTLIGIRRLSETGSEARYEYVVMRPRAALWPRVWKRWTSGAVANLEEAIKTADLKTDIEVATGPATPALASLLKQLWREVLQRNYDRGSLGGLDGTTYHFWEGVGGSAQTWSPAAGTRLGDLVQIGMLLGEAARDPQRRAIIEAELDLRTRALLARVKDSTWCR
jgi:hypothetical protein